MRVSLGIETEFITFSSVERTLGMEEVDGFVKKILKRLSEKDIVLR